ncbi:transglutaminase-like domain-containing protein [Anaeromyxobacter diazotrophicus]|uniref:Transglutaminase n=1 Tax=Anaeromyxobacter diazotrophicus TaxID=2590199 RepID=A0A7I9VSC7_9BACT|nr:transglutaminase-like domain-containing protein [Anaeromyxobacter diazotrophicus]GEJ59353.1 transglutaminase [Anaeromyxobacter diazotrophicus]
MTRALALAFALAALTLAGGARAAQPTVVNLARPAQPEWFGVYLMGKKAGFSTGWVGLEVRDGQRVLVAKNTSTLSATVGDRTVKRTQQDEKVYEARPGGRLLSFSSRREGDGGDRTVEGRCTPQGCRAILTAQGQREERALPPVGETAEQADAARLAAARREAVRGEQLDLETLRVKKMEDRFVGLARAAAGGVEAELAQVEEREAGDRAATRVSFAPDGRVVELRLGDAVSARAEPADTAQRLDKVDLFGMTRVKLPGPLPRRVPGALVFRLRGVPREFQAPDPRQSWSPQPDGAVLLTVTARRPAAADPARDAARVRGLPPELKEDLAPTPEVDSDAPVLQALSRQVVGDTRGAYAASVKLVHFVYGRLEKAYGVSRDRATEVLALGKGDCTEHALLFTALARAAGIPARQVHGLVYARYDDGVPALYWHAWVEVKSGGEWIAVDPTFDQPVADPTHVVLGRGPQVDTVGLLGALQVVSAKPKG